MISIDLWLVVALLLAAFIIGILLGSTLVRPRSS
jgi:hypothetical protein